MKTAKEHPEASVWSEVDFPCWKQGLICCVLGTIPLLVLGVGFMFFIVLAGVSVVKAVSRLCLKDRLGKWAAVVDLTLTLVILFVFLEIPEWMLSSLFKGFVGVIAGGVFMFGIKELLEFVFLIRSSPRNGFPSEMLGRPLFSNDPVLNQELVAILAAALKDKQRLDEWTAPLPDRIIEEEARNLIYPLLSPASQAAWDAAWTFEYALARTKDDPNHAAARIGGLPLLPTRFVWPEKEGETYIFVASIDLSRIAAEAPHPHLPSDGFLFFFCAEGEYEDGRVVYSPGPCVVQADPAMPVLSNETAIRISPRWVVNSEESAFWSDLERLKESDNEEVVRAATILTWMPEADHHMLGIPKEIQCPPEEDWERLVEDGFGSPPELFENEEDRKWILLLQLDSDRSLDMYWGDMGCIYFGIRLGDLKNRRFEKVVVACEFH